MSSVMWSTLTLDLIAMVIVQTVDAHSLDSWCEATIGNHHLHVTAMRARWRHTTIDDRDLIPAPGADEHEFNETQRTLRRNKLALHWKPSGYMVNLLLSTVQGTNHCPAHYVQDLIFDFRMLRYLEDDIRDFWEEPSPTSELGFEDYEIQGIGPRDLMPTVKSLDYTLTKLKGQFHSLRNLRCYGDTPQVLLDFVTSQDAVKIQSLEMASLGGYGRLQIPWRELPSTRQHPLGRWPLHLERLSVLQTLESLEIWHLSNKETRSLLTVMPKLVNLRCLTLACEAEEHDVDYGGCAFRAMFEQIPQITQNVGPASAGGAGVPGSAEWLPVSLKKLSLIDTYKYGGLVEMPSAQRPRSQIQLTHICLDIGNADWISILVNCFPAGSLQSFSIPWVSSNSSEVARSNHAYVDDAIIKFGDTLGQLRLTRAWNIDPRWMEKFNDQWQELFAVQELVLGTRDPDWYWLSIQTWRERVPNPTLSHFLHGFGRQPHNQKGRWGGTLERIRIDHIDISGLDVSAIAEPSYSRLKILMLQPDQSTMGYESPTESEEAEELACFKVAEQIVRQGATSIRVIVISTHWYWVSRNPSGQESNGQLWKWRQAKTDLAQSKTMASTLDGRDHNFLKGSAVPLWHERDLKEWHRNESSAHRPYTPSKEMLHQWNYVTVYRRDFCSGLND